MNKRQKWVLCCTATGWIALILFILFGWEQCALQVYGQSAVPPSAVEIVQQAEAGYRAGVTNEDVTLVVTLVDERDRREVRELQYTVAMATADDGEKKLLRFLSPADVRATGLLSLEHRDRPDDQWLYLRSLGKARRMGGAERFIGTDYSAADTRAENTTAWEYGSMTVVTFEYDRAHGGGTVPCARIEATPSTGTTTEYTRRILWYHRELPILIREVLEDRDGVWKTRTRWQIRSFPIRDGVSVPRAQFEEMADHRIPHRTLLEARDRRFNVEFPESTFTVHALQRGR